MLTSPCTGLFYDFTGNDIRAEMAYTEASKLNFSLARAEHEEKEREKEKLREKERGEFDGESTDMLLSESDAAKGYCFCLSFSLSHAFPR